VSDTNALLAGMTGTATAANDSNKHATNGGKKHSGKREYHRAQGIEEIRDVCRGHYANWQEEKPVT
jgi:hypothetical protein